MKPSSSLLELVITHFGPVAGASWEYFLVYNISKEWGSPERGRPESMFYSSSLSLGVACFGFCLMFLLKTILCVCVCLVATLVWVSAVPPLSASLYIDTCMCVCCVNKSVHVFVWVSHPWRDEKPWTICYAAVGHNRQHCCGVQQYEIAQWLKAIWRFIWTSRLVSQLPNRSNARRKSFCTPSSNWLLHLPLCLTTVLCSAIGQLSHVSLFDQFSLNMRHCSTYKYKSQVIY